ncbi:MAG: SDR family oxidoreductase, partial [Betaproteobacteria bacterium]|nr:SDR family oxidoreductase [Betaproteobacteria bacterium]
EADGTAVEAELVLRSQPTRNLLFPEIDLIAQQYQVMTQLGAHSDVPVPRTRWAERDTSVLGGPFFVMDRLDGLVHAIAFAPREAIAGDFLEGVSREAFRIAHDVSSYSLIAVCKQAQSMLVKAPSSVVTLSYLGAERMVPNYNTMGLAKASLEAGVRYLAGSLSPQGVRVNAISAGPIKTLAASGIKGFSKILEHVQQHAPIRRNVDLEDVGNVAAFLLSDLSRAMTGEILYVDGGFHWVASGIGGEAAS